LTDGRRIRSGRPGRRAAGVVVAVLALSLTGVVALAGPLAGASSPQRLRPRITQWPIPFGPKRKRQMAAYSERHYGEHTWRLRHPHVIVEHVAEAGSAAAVRNTFAPDVPDPELHELPNVCSHFVVSSSGRIFQLVNLRTRCRHTVGLNWTAIGIEHVGFSDGDVLGNPRQLHASLQLTQYLRCRFKIGLSNVIGHAESLSSPYHRERVAALRNQTHSDWQHSDMQIYRRKLRRLGPC
jgi:N-acetylmuramoyl-L-alanine amidase